MNRIRQTISLALVVAMVSLGLTAARAQQNDLPSYDQAANLIRRVELSMQRFRSSVQMMSGGYDTQNQLNGYLQNIQNATATLRTDLNNDSDSPADVQNILQQAVALNNFMLNASVSARVQNNWSQLRSNLDALARAYNVTWNWNQAGSPYGTSGYGTPTYNYPNGSQVGYGYDMNGRLTGTFRLDPSMSDNANAVADRAVRTVAWADRQRVREQIMRRLQAPDMIAIQRNGNNVTIASSRAPQTTFVANGVENREQMPNGSYSRVVAQINGDQLTVRSAGNRETDFTVTFQSIDGGQRLRVTRQIWNDTLGQNPVVVQNVYDRTSDVADWSVYNGTNNGNYGYGQTGSVAPNGSFIVPDGTMLNATLNNDLSTQTANTGDRFTMTVNSPQQFAGAVIDGHVANVARSGRITGRSEMSLNFDDIRMPDGSTYQFAGFLDSVNSANGDTVRVDNEGTVSDRSQTTQTEERAAIGTAVGALIGAIAGGGKGAAIGAILGAGAGAGSVYAEGRNDLNLLSGSQVTIRASAPNR
jgi:hypothetical protein